MKKNQIPKWVRRCLDFQKQFDDLPDGAFFGVAQEKGIPIEDWAAFGEWQAKNPDWEQL